MRNRVLGSSPSGGNITENKGHCENELSQIQMKKFLSKVRDFFSKSNQFSCTLQENNFDEYLIFVFI